MNEENIRLSALFVSQYNQNKRMNWGGVAKIVMEQTYNSFVREGVITPIEYLPIEEKMSLVAECRLTGEGFTNETLTAMAKALHVIKTINSST